MDRSAATRLRDRVLEVYASLDAVVIAADETLTGEERQRTRRAVGQIMARMTELLLDPIVREHPDLDPDRHPTETQ